MTIAYSAACYIERSVISSLFSLEVWDWSQHHQTVTIVCSTATLRGQLFFIVLFGGPGFVSMSPDSDNCLLSCYFVGGRLFLVLLGGPGLVSTSPDTGTIVYSTATLIGLSFLVVSALGLDCLHGDCPAWHQVFDV